MYIIVVLGLVLGALGIVLETFIEAYYAVIGIMIILGTTGVLCLIFIPKVSVCVVCVCVCWMLLSNQNFELK